LIIGAYLSIGWTDHYDELLGILNLMKSYFPDEEKSIVHYLNAYKMYFRDSENFLSNSHCLEELCVQSHVIMVQ